MTKETQQALDSKGRVSMKPLRGEHTCVVGLMWGDEGKGKIVDALTADFSIVARYNGGANAGHTVIVGKEKFALHLIPSGIVHENVLNLVCNGVALDLPTVLGEIDGLRSRGVAVGDNLKFSNKTHLVFPYHKLEDILSETRLKKGKLGTTARGIGPCYADKATRTRSIRLGELFQPDRFREKLTRIVEEKNLMLNALYGRAEGLPIDAGAIFDEFQGYAERIRPHVCDTTHLLHEALASDKPILFEGAQGCLLDPDHGTFPFVTSSPVNIGGVATGAGVPPQRIKRVIGIVKAYSTRVGAGPFPSELTDAIGDRIRERGQEYGTTTGRPRRTGWFDAVAATYTARINGVTELAVMLTDVMSGFKTIRLCTAYRRGGKELNWFDSNEQAMTESEPVYEEMEGWEEEITECRRFESLPLSAQRYIERIEQVLGIAVKVVSVGPERSETIWR